jgi:hypothetical protein
MFNKNNNILHLCNKHILKIKALLLPRNLLMNGQIILSSLLKRNYSELDKRYQDKYKFMKDGHDKDEK